MKTKFQISPRIGLGYPLARQFVLSFQEYGLAQQFGRPAEWVGLRNYVESGIPLDAAVTYDLLVTIFQRGAVDGLNMIVPFGESSYYSSRPTIAIGRPRSGSPTSTPRAELLHGHSAPENRRLRGRDPRHARGCPRR